MSDDLLINPALITFTASPFLSTHWFKNQWNSSIVVSNKWYPKPIRAVIFVWQLVFLSVEKSSIVASIVCGGPNKSADRVLQIFGACFENPSKIWWFNSPIFTNRSFQKRLNEYFFWCVSDIDFSRSKKNENLRNRKDGKAALSANSLLKSLDHSITDFICVTQTFLLYVSRKTPQKIIELGAKMTFQPLRSSATCLVNVVVRVTYRGKGLQSAQTLSSI